MGDQNDLATRIAQATGIQPEKVCKVVQLALQDLHRITIVDEKGPTAAVMEACFSFGGEAAFHLIGLYASEHDYHDRDDDAGMWNEVAMRFIPTAYREGCARIAPWFAEKTPERLRLDADIRERSRPMSKHDEQRDTEQRESAHPLKLGARRHKSKLRSKPASNRQMSVPELKALARKHWEEWLPEKVKTLKAEGKLNEALQGAANLAQTEIEHLMKHGYHEHEAREVALSQFILLPPEGDGLDDWEREELAAKEREYQRNPPPQVMFDREDELDTDMIEKLPPANPAEGLKPIREWEEDLLDTRLKAIDDRKVEKNKKA